MPHRSFLNPDIRLAINAGVLFRLALTFGQRVGYRMCALDHLASAILMLGKDKWDISALTVLISAEN